MNERPLLCDVDGEPVADSSSFVYKTGERRNKLRYEPVSRPLTKPPPPAHSLAAPVVAKAAVQLCVHACACVYLPESTQCCFCLVVGAILSRSPTAVDTLKSLLQG